MEKISKEHLSKILKKDFSFYSVNDSSKNLSKGRAIYLVSEELGVEVESQDFKSGSSERRKIIKEVLRMFKLLLNSLKPEKGIIFRAEEMAWLYSDMLSEKKQKSVMTTAKFCEKHKIPLNFKGGLSFNNFYNSELSSDLEFLISSSVDAIYGYTMLLYSNVSIVVSFPPCPLIYIFTDDESQLKRILNEIVAKENKVLLSDPSNIQNLYKNPTLFRSN